MNALTTQAQNAMFCAKKVAFVGNMVDEKWGWLCIPPFPRAAGTTCLQLDKTAGISFTVLRPEVQKQDGSKAGLHLKALGNHPPWPLAA